MTPSALLPELSAAPARATGVIVVDIARIAANWRALAARVAPAECAAVVKADAYGLGVGEVVPALATAGCRTFFVATPEEAEQTCKLAAGAIVYVLDGVLDPGLLSAIDAQPVLGDTLDVETWRNHCKHSGRTLPAALQIETGLNRRGISFENLRELADLGPSRELEVTLVMSHLACADDPGHGMNEAQRSRFTAAKALLPAARASLAASDGLMLGSAYHFDVVRPGYALYGGQAFQGGRAPVEPVVRAYARILQIRNVGAGETVGYSATWRTKSRRQIATIAAGYADGVFRHASGSDDKAGGLVAVAGQLCPIVGRVSMDLVTADVTDAVSDTTASAPPPPWAELIGPSLPIETVGARAGTIGYEVLTRLGRRFHRIYQGT